MESIGEYLKKEREVQGVPLEEIAKATHISLRFLEAIEEEDFKRLPGDIFVKGFIKTYADYIGLDSTELVNRYKKRFENKQDEIQGKKTLEAEPKPQSFPEISQQRQSKVLPVALGVLALLGLGYYLIDFVMVGPRISSKTDESRRDRPASEVDGANIPPPESEGDTAREEVHGIREEATPEVFEKRDEVLTVGEKPQEDRGAAEKSLETSIPVPSDMQKMEMERKKPTPEKTMDAKTDVVAEKKNMVLKMTAQSDAWLLVKMDGSEGQKDFILKAGETVIFKADKEFSVTTGNATGVKLFLNGKEIFWPKKGSVIHDFLITRPEKEGEGEKTLTLPPL